MGTALTGSVLRTSTAAAVPWPPWLESLSLSQARGQRTEARPSAGVAAQ